MSCDNAPIAPQGHHNVADVESTPTPERDNGDSLSRERREALQAFWQTVRRIPAYVRLVAALMRDGRVPRRARLALIVGGAYTVSPIDLVPGLIPVAGQLDDAYVLLTAVRQAIRWSPDDVADEHLARLDLNREIIDADLAAVRELVRVGVVSGVRWGRGGFNAGRAWLGKMMDDYRRRKQ